MGNLMDTSRKVTGADTKLTWIDEDFLATQMKPEEMNFAPWGPMHGEEAGGSLTGMKASADQGLKARVARGDRARHARLARDAAGGPQGAAEVGFLAGAGSRDPRSVEGAQGLGGARVAPGGGPRSLRAATAFARSGTRPGLASAA